MEDVIEIGSSDSGDSIIEVELPKKPSPPLIEIEDEEMVLNVMQKEGDSMLARDFIQDSQVVSAMAGTVSGISTGVNSPKHWTLDMVKFYDDDWGDEDQFIVEKLQEKMDKSPFLWDVSTKHFLHMRNKYSSYIRCWNCNQRGHHSSKCPDPPYVPKCFMCGVEGHLDYCCPNSKCLNCGNSSREYVNSCYKCRNRLNEVCSRCQQIGHNFVTCPDHWRLFHLTTDSLTVNVPDRNVYKSVRDMWCCNCGKRGHHHTQCSQRKHFSGFKSTLPFVVSYQRAFDNNYNVENSKEFHWKRRKGSQEEILAGRILKVNPLNKAIRKNKNYKNKQRKIRKNRNKKKRKQATQEIKI